MELLLDTHTFLWWLAGEDRLSLAARTAISNEDNGIFISAASAWEIAMKHRLGKLHGVAPLVADIDSVIAGQGFNGLAISVRHGKMAGALPGPHRDPFDRMLIAQAMLEGMVLVSNERPFDDYGISRLW